ncbi:LysR substrate-binding domain-containing protein [Phenylobacterium sp.]|uniref:LysR substrate-binding domain-containing protein n=1 Tax=Phenylobacterium sp. TaxID=1871053 RepID=UPI0025CD8CA9|nr:LysR substrate-binding domain-containing protein [Phenylobacterium sp.]
MELRHLRYFVAVAEEGSLTVAAEKRLHTAQPSLSRQLRDLEQEVGAQLFLRTSRGVELTPAGQAFLEHARLSLHQAREAVAAARRVARPAKTSFAVGFLTGQEVEWLRHVTHVLKDQLKDIDLRVSSDFSPHVADAVERGDIDLGFSRVEPRPDVSYKVIAHEPIVVILPRDHPLASDTAIDPRDLDPHGFIGYSETPHVLRGIVDRYLRERGVTVSPTHFLDGFATGISLVASTGGVTLLPAYVEPLLPASLVSRPLVGNGPVIEVAAGYRPDNPSPILKFFLENIDTLTASRSRHAGGGSP